jgi:copper oxidase (laccase) domain-containing protein
MTARLPESASVCFEEAVNPAKRMFDLPGSIRAEFASYVFLVTQTTCTRVLRRRAGVVNIEVLPWDTHEHQAGFFSYRLNLVYLLRASLAQRTIELYDERR